MVDKIKTHVKIMSRRTKRARILALCAMFILSVASTWATAFVPQKASAISTDTRPTLVGNEIKMGPNGGHIIMQGVNVWGIETITMSGFGNAQYADRVNITNTVKSWGANHVRFRLQASDYNAMNAGGKTQYLNRIQEWHDLITGAGMYFMPVWWDAHDGPYSDTNWPTQYSQAFPMMTAVMNLFPNDPMVMYEPFNEPTGAVNDVQWLAAMQATITHYRTNGYTGILLIDPRVWAHCYEAGAFTQLEQHDASQPGMNGTHQIIFTKHDYAREYNSPAAGFDPANWLTNNGGGTCTDWKPADHAVWESEFGNYSLDPSSVHPAWSAGAAQFLNASTCNGTIAGATAFLFGPWLDANGMTAADNSTPTLWGSQVNDMFLTPCQGNPLNGIGTLGNLIFYDSNKDGVYNPADGDHGISDVTVAIYAQNDNTCSVASSATPLLTQTTNNDGRYQFTLLPTDDGISANGPGARYAVVVTDANDKLSQYQHTTGAADANDNSQSQPAFCAELTNAASDIQYADFGFGPRAGSGGGEMLADTGLPVAAPAGAAAALLFAGALLTNRKRLASLVRRSK